MSEMVKCVKCSEEKPSLDKPPFRPGTKLAPLGVEITEKICAACYRDWIAMSIKLVNELRIDTTDARGQEVWLKQMKLFLNLEQSADPWSRHLDKKVRVETVKGVIATATLIGIDDTSLSLADFDGGSVPEGFHLNDKSKGSASIARDAVRTVDSAAASP